jgi:hypothetical protein
VLKDATVFTSSSTLSAGLMAVKAGTQAYERGKKEPQ